MKLLAASATALTVSVALVLGTGVAVQASPSARTDGYPSWQDVQNAQANEAAKQNEINVLNAALQTSQQKAAKAQQDEALEEEAYNTAQAALDAATAKADDLKAKQAAAEADAAAAAKRAAGVIASLDHTGGGDPTLGLLTGSGQQADQLLQRLGTMNRLSATSAGILTSAEFAKNAAETVARQASVAEAKRADLAVVAKQDLAAAQAAEAAAETEVESEQAAQETMFAQLAALKNTTAQVEAAYEVGVQQANAAAGIPPLPPGAIGVVIAFAERQLGDRYVLGGAGPTVWDCSGLTMWAYAQAGVSLSHLTYSQEGEGRVVPLSQIQPGDLVFYWGGGHVALYVGGGSVIHAPHTGDVVRYGSLYMGTPELVVRPTG